MCLLYRQVWAESLETDAESIANTAGNTLNVSGDVIGAVTGGDRDDEEEGDRPMLGPETKVSLNTFMKQAKQYVYTYTRILKPPPPPQQQQ